MALLGMKRLIRCVFFIAILSTIATSIAETTLAPEDGLIAHWKFDEASGLLALDSSGNGNDAKISGAVYVEGRFGTALSLDGINDYLFAPDAQSGGVTASGLDMGTRD